jgi:hypothetical protein
MLRFGHPPPVIPILLLCLLRVLITPHQHLL